jgi:hypothetical protein
MFQKLKDYAAIREDKQLSSKFKDRYRLRVKEKDREKCLQALKEWNKRLFVVTRQAQREPPPKKSVSASPTRPSGHLRDLSCVLYHALSNYWNCGCAIRHEARFCLRPKEGLHKCPDPSELDFSLLFSAPTTGAGVAWRWQEGRVLVRSRLCVHQTLNSFINNNLLEVYQLQPQKSAFRSIRRSAKRNVPRYRRSVTPLKRRRGMGTASNCLWKTAATSSICGSYDHSRDNFDTLNLLKQ